MTTIIDTFIKAPADEVDYDIDFSTWLSRRSEPDSALTAVVTVSDGIELLDDDLNPDTGVVKVWLAGGSAGKTYYVTAVLSSAGTRVKTATIAVKVKD